MSRHATPELVKLAERAMRNDPESVAGDLVRSWKEVLAENQRLRDALELIALTEEHGGADYERVTAGEMRRIACETLDASPP